MPLDNWMGFCSIALLATATPGPAALLVSVNSLTVGFRRSLLTVLGNVTGLFMMSGCSVLGLSALVLHSVTAFMVIKMVGALYLIYMGVNLWKTGITPMHAQATQSKRGNLKLYAQGVMVALTNPKAIVFTTALFPQFVNVSEPILPQFSLLVISFMCLSFICLSTYAWFAHTAKHKTLPSTVARHLGRAMGGLFIGFGCLLVTVSR